MQLAFRLYIICWMSGCITAIFFLMKNWKEFALTKVEYWQFLFASWRLTTFAAAASMLIVVAPYSGDVTWDYFDAFFVSVLTYITAPWSIGVIYNTAKGKLSLSQGFVAVCAWMFSASWSYDLYILLRDGSYPATWLANIFASSVLYISAGLFWNLDWVEGRGVTFAFLENNWPYYSSKNVFSKVVLYTLPFMLLVSCLMIYFFLL